MAGRRQGSPTRGAPASGSPRMGVSQRNVTSLLIRTRRSPSLREFVFQYALPLDSCRHVAAWSSLHSKISYRRTPRGVLQARPAQRNQNGCEQVATPPRVNEALGACQLGSHASSMCIARRFAAPHGPVSPGRNADTALRHAMRQSILCTMHLPPLLQLESSDLPTRPAAFVGFIMFDVLMWADFRRFESLLDNQLLPGYLISSRPSLCL